MKKNLQKLLLSFLIFNYESFASHLVEDELTSAQASIRFYNSLIKGYEKSENNEEHQQHVTLLKKIYLAAENGNGKCQCKLGQLYLCVHPSLDKDYKLSFYFLNKAVNNKIPEAYGYLSAVYFYGLEREKNINKALELALLGAEANEPQAYIILGEHYGSFDTEGDKNKSFDYYLKAAKLGIARTYLIIGKMYEEGIGIPVDKNKAFEWYKKAVDNDIPCAYCALGQCYIKGDGVEKNCDEGLKLLKTGAEKEDVITHIILAEYYIDGKIIAQDLDEAEKWATQPVVINDPRAINLVNKINDLKMK